MFPIGRYCSSQGGERLVRFSLHLSIPFKFRRKEGIGRKLTSLQLSLGDARSYYLSTAANELGVVYATSEEGNPMVPVSYQEMEDTVTGKVEKRKVAKPEGV